METSIKNWKLIKESNDNYMVKANLTKLYNHISELLKLDDNTLSNLDPWAIDHITTSTDDIEEVYNFLINSEVNNENLWDNIRKKRKRLGVKKIGSNTSTFKSKKEFNKIAKDIADKK